MTHDEKIAWMKEYAFRNKLILDLEGEVGIMRECVGVTNGNNYPDYHWYNEDFKREDENGKVWTPPNAYHKHPCVAVLGRGESAESQLYDWLKWFEDNGYKVVEATRMPNANNHIQDTFLDLLMNGATTLRMVKEESHAN